jgi:MoaA/NifB/PqqE/SkfB family radical SAM enzyme
LDCITCFRNGWDEPNGKMSEATFAAILESLKKLDPLPSVYFGGIGEPLYHSYTLEWVKQVKALGGKVELITNATLLTEKVTRRLIDSGLDLLWVSLDGASTETYADVRLGAEFPKVMENAERWAFPHSRVGHRFCGHEAQHWRIAQSHPAGTCLARQTFFSQQFTTRHR